MAKQEIEKHKTTKVLHCTCKHDFQDATYGAGNRVHNECGKGGRVTSWKCTVCENVK